MRSELAPSLASLVLFGLLILCPVPCPGGATGAPAMEPWSRGHSYGAEFGPHVQACERNLGRGQRRAHCQKEEGQGSPGRAGTAPPEVSRRSADSVTRFLRPGG